MRLLGRLRPVLCFSFAALLGACDNASSPPPATPATGYGTAPYYGQPAGYNGQPQYGAPQQYPNGYGAPPPQYGQTYAPPGAAPAPYPAPQAAAPAPAPIYTGPDPITNTDINWLRAHAAAIMQELIAALPDVAKVRVQSIPLDVDDTPGEVNAYASCEGSKAAMTVTDGLLDIGAHLAAARANDDVFGTQKVTAYIQFIGQSQQPNQPIAEPPQGFFDPSQAADSRRVSRQHDVFDEMLGFILGHELAHHHLGHLPCTGGSGPLGVGNLVRGLSGSVPMFNQPNEIAADTAGTDTVLTAGARRPGYHLTEGGALLVMQFFSATDQLSPSDILFGFDRTHPPPALRIPVIQQTANYWRVSGGGWVPLLRM
jgi:hypothetical protein